MPFTGKATYAAGASLPEIAEDVSDIVGIITPHETPLLDALGDPARSARSTVHEWLEDSLLPNADVVVDLPAADTVEVANVSRFRAGDIVNVRPTGEVLLVNSVDVPNDTIGVTRGYGGSTSGAIQTDDELLIVGNASLEGADADAARFTSRTRQTNYTQIFASTVEVSGSELAVRQIGVRDELDYQKNQRLRELLRDLENSVINGVAPAANPQGGSSVRRSMRGILACLSSNLFEVGVDGFPSDTTLSESTLNFALRQIWQGSAGNIDLIVVGGNEKRAINQFVATNRRFTPLTDSYRDSVAVYESDFGVCRVVLSRHVPAGSVLLLDSSRIEVLPLAGRHFHYKPLASTGDRDCGQVIGEYTLELRNEAAHAVIRGFTG